eukprot:CAMPEP_0114560800 /NCGR_PEP_ID=MMETSP0114-20121206/11653_1 /TAXON_ID=31324 /ORGANISM="Goniomonas sp, Strain m" /LENGTH=1366 /DNA_ID=CAMNT_0001746371 /DNA_START=50 /DNA_END=4147 /DNA_ORIENTATION=+
MASVDEGPVGDSYIKVVVRVRPFNSREKAKGAECVVKMDPTTTIIRNPTDGTPKNFTFDHSYWSFDEKDEHFASQSTVFNDLGKFAIGSALGGYNVSIFAYGQTGAGKTHSIIGYQGDPGIVPRLMEALFERISASHDRKMEFKVEAAMLEIYNDHIRDLFNPRNSAGWNLRVREHPKSGPFVEGLSWLVAKDLTEIGQMLETGYKARTVAATHMNDESSRSHAIFQVLFTQTETTQIEDKGQSRKRKTSKMSKISLVDLAGSERYGTETLNTVEQQRQAEGRHINKSLSTLANCIYALYRAAKNSNNSKIHVPYRDSSLTWLLRESLGGNARTVMMAAISPADICYEESLSTLRYASRAKRIRTHAVINEDINEKIIRELRAEINQLREELKAYQSSIDNPRVQLSAQELKERLENNEKMIGELDMSWDEKVRRTERIMEEQKHVDEDEEGHSPRQDKGPSQDAYPQELPRSMNLGISLSGLGASLNVDHKCPQLVNLNEDPLPTEFLVYFLSQGETTVGSANGKDKHVELTGPSILPLHATVTTDGRRVTVTPEPKAITFINGTRVTAPTVLRQGNRVAFGRSHIFRFNDPEEAARIRREREKFLSSQETDEIAPPPPVADWEFAMGELQTASAPAAGGRRPRRKAAPRVPGAALPPVLPDISEPPPAPVTPVEPLKAPVSVLQTPPPLPLSPQAEVVAKQEAAAAAAEAAAAAAVPAPVVKPLPPLSPALVESMEQCQGQDQPQEPPPELGIGVLLQRQGNRTSILDLVAGGPAHASGQLHVGLLVREVDGHLVEQLEFQDVLSLIRGPVGTSVSLLVEDPATGVSKLVLVSRTLMQQPDGEVSLPPIENLGEEDLGEEDLGSEASGDDNLENLEHAARAVVEQNMVEEDLGEELDDDEEGHFDLSVLPVASGGKAGEEEEDLGEELGDEVDDGLTSLENMQEAGPATTASQTAGGTKTIRTTLALGGDLLEDSYEEFNAQLCIRVLIQANRQGEEEAELLFPIETCLLQIRNGADVSERPVPPDNHMELTFSVGAGLAALAAHCHSVLARSQHAQGLVDDLTAQTAAQVFKRIVDLQLVRPISKGEQTDASLFALHDGGRKTPVTFLNVFHRHSRNALVVGEGLIRRLLSCIAVVPDGDARNSPAFDSFVQSTAELQVVDVGGLSVHGMQAFFINVYNCLCIHAHATRGLPDGCDFKPSKAAFMKDAQYRIGGHNYSLEDILNRVLRYKAVRKSGASASRTVPEPRIHFVLTDGTRSSPSIGVFSMHNLNEELDQAACNFCQREVAVNLSNKTVTLPRVFKWYGADFGRDKAEILRFVAGFMGDDAQREITQLAQSGSFKIKYKEYDWRLQLRQPLLPRLPP